MYIFFIYFYSYYFARPHKLQSFNFNCAEIKAVCLSKEALSPTLNATLNCQKIIIYLY